jgi:hypothetical protein
LIVDTDEFKKFKKKRMKGGMEEEGQEVGDGEVSLLHFQGLEHVADEKCKGGHAPQVEEDGEEGGQRSATLCFSYLRLQAD